MEGAEAKPPPSPVKEEARGGGEAGNGDEAEAATGEEAAEEAAGAEDAAPPSPSLPASPLFPRIFPTPTLNLYDVSSYTFGTKEYREKNRGDDDGGGGAANGGGGGRERRLEQQYKQRGMRRSVGAVLLVQNHRFPHILLLQSSTRSAERYLLPGGRLRAGESAVDGLRRKLANKLSPLGDIADAPSWDIGEQVANFYHPDFSRNTYPYIPAHVTHPKESLAVYVVQLPEACTFAVPKHLQLLAVPLFEIYDSKDRYGAVITVLPVLLSRFHVNFIGGS